MNNPSRCCIQFAHHPIALTADDIHQAQPIRLVVQVMATLSLSPVAMSRSEQQ